MNGKKGYLFDTNILIYFLAGKLPENVVEEIENILEQSFYISVITKLEILGWKGHTEETFKETKSFIENAVIIGLEDKIVDKSISLRRQRKIKLPDAIIAATAIVHKKIWLLKGKVINY
ncbi:type II toxin-antitoxin system VapC family toxin [Desulfurobacterium thermolithotrophum]|uniref:type II toxin-antitoxin system VapC family toxin n=1 Tax=Desulfurobacterium thermolithotrophum TaxID=64160 RepID=UPI0013D2F4DD|nr:type II toxin-antitoxin system VapC family toxin [Desulfurobacterium thermolithotrophum]